MQEQFMNLAIKEAEKAVKKDEVPVGAIIVKDNKVIARAHNLMEKTQLATAHAEILAINKACKKLKSWRLDGAEMYITVEPCSMCAGAIVNARIKKVYFDANKQKEKNIKEVPIEKMQTDGTSEKIIKDFFKNKRK